jgi:hypothetical protein
LTVFSLAYYSRSNLDDLVLDTRVEIDSILRVSSAKNKATGLTGALMFNEDRFTQVLEGDESEVRATYHRIERDLRHRDVTTIFAGPVTHRRFSQWSMIFVGDSPAAKSYYKDYVANLSDSPILPSNSLVPLMLKLISLNQDDPLIQY